MTALSDAQLDQLIVDIGLKRPPGGSQRKPINHGTLAGYKQHRYRGEAACTDCLRGLADYQRERSLARSGEPTAYLTEEEWQARRAARQSGGVQ